MFRFSISIKTGIYMCDEQQQQQPARADRISYPKRKMLTSIQSSLLSYRWYSQHPAGIIILRWDLAEDDDNDDDYDKADDNEAATKPTNQPTTHSSPPPPSKSVRS